MTTTHSTISDSEYRKALEKVGLSVYGSARFFGISLRQAQRFAAGEYPVPRAHALLLKLMLRHKLKHDFVAALIEK